MSTAFRSLALLLTTKCDIACKYCFYTTGHEKRDSSKFDPANTKLLSTKLKALGFNSVILSGGDPLGRVYKRTCLRVTEQLESENISVVINTSGSSLTSEDCDEIIRIRPTRLDFSIDSHLASVHDGLRGGYSNTVNAISYLIQNGYHSIVTTSVLTGLNQDHIVETVKFLQGLGVGETRVQPVFLPTDLDTADNPLSLRLTAEKAASLHSGLTAVLNQRAHHESYLRWWEGFYSPSSHGDEPRKKPRCQMGKRVFVSDANLNLSACFHRTDVKLGNLLQDSEESLLQAINNHELAHERLPSCVGKQCLSLFDHHSNWTNEGDENEYSCKPRRLEAIRTQRRLGDAMASSSDEPGGCG